MSHSKPNMSRFRKNVMEKTRNTHQTSAACSSKVKNEAQEFKVVHFLK
jgi:hypothetical protein